MTTTGPRSRAAAPRRDGLTLAVFALILVSAVLQASLGGILPFLRAEVPMSHTVESLHITALAVGGLVAALLVEPVRLRVGRLPILVGAAVLGAVAGALLLVATSPALSIGSLVLVGVSMSSALIVGQTLLVAAHGPHGPQMIGELSVAYSVGAVGASALLPAVAATAFGWRGLPALQGVLLLALVVPLLLRARRPVAEGAVATSSAAGTTSLRRPRLAYAAMCLCVAVEWSFMFWFATYLVSARGLTETGAAGAASVMWAAILVGRVAGSRAMGRFGAPAVLAASLVLGVVAAAVMTAASSTPLAVVAAVLAGLAAANLYPGSVALVVAGHPDRPDAAVARASLLTSAAVILFPLVLGRLADAVGLRLAFVVVPVTALIALGTIRLAGPLPTAKPDVAASDQTDKNHQGATS